VVEELELFHCVRAHGGGNNGRLGVVRSGKVKGSRSGEAIRPFGEAAVLVGRCIYKSIPSVRRTLSKQAVFDTVIGS
jgi:hypothetical protein